MFVFGPIYQHLLTVDNYSCEKIWVKILKLKGTFLSVAHNHWTKITLQQFYSVTKLKNPCVFVTLEWAVYIYIESESPLHGVHHVAQPYLYSSPEPTIQTLLTFPAWARVRNVTRCRQRRSLSLSCFTTHFPHAHTFYTLALFQMIYATLTTSGFREGHSHFRVGHRCSSTGLAHGEASVGQSATSPLDTARCYTLHLLSFGGNECCMLTC